VRCCVLLFAVACSNVSVPYDAQGRVGGTDFASSVTIATTDPHQTLLIFADVGVECADLAAGGIPGRAADALYVLLSDVVQNQQYPASFDQSYNVGDTTAVAKAWFMRWNDSCQVVEQTPAVTGAAEINLVNSAGLAGNFNFAFASGSIYGHFDVVLCPPIAQADPPLCL
jgi:hypothetical protein